jgi:hypothetical protein
MESPIKPFARPVFLAERITMVARVFARFVPTCGGAVQLSPLLLDIM